VRCSGRVAVFVIAAACLALGIYGGSLLLMVVAGIATFAFATTLARPTTTGRFAGWSAGTGTQTRKLTPNHITASVSLGAVPGPCLRGDAAVPLGPQRTLRQPLSAAVPVAL
jgi:hypothetical protein